jgi:phospholipase/lecithinase/hemolysin
MQMRAYMQRLIELGAKRIVVPGNLPIGCTLTILTLYASHSKSDYDKYGCLDKFNDLARYHNELLRQEVQALQDKYNLTKIAFVDYFRPVVEFLQTPAEFGEINHNACFYSMDWIDRSVLHA